eukprot:scaffold373810_cov34-Prasinocladus_malaysianus.AAC.1
MSSTITAATFRNPHCKEGCAATHDDSGDMKWQHATGNICELIAFRRARKRIQNWMVLRVDCICSERWFMRDSINFVFKHYKATSNSKAVF